MKNIKAKSKVTDANLILMRYTTRCRSELEDHERN